MMPRSSRILIVSKHNLIGEAFQEYLRNHSRGYRALLSPVSKMTSVPDEFLPDLVLFLGMAQHSKEVKAAMNLFPEARYLLVGEFRDTAEAVEWLRLGMHGLMAQDHDSNTLQTLEEALTKVRQGEVWASRRILSAMCQTKLRPVSPQGALTNREEEVMQLLNLGLSNPAISKGLGISEKTVKRHLTNIYRKLNVENRTQAVLKQQEESDFPDRVLSFQAVHAR